MDNPQNIPRLQLDAILGLPIQRTGPAYTLVRLLQGMQCKWDTIRLFSPLDRWNPNETDITFVTPRTGISLIDSRLPFRHFENILQRFSEQRLLQRNNAEEHRLVYTWGYISLETTRKLHRRGNIVVREKFNCAQKVAREILIDAYREITSENYVAIRDEAIHKEQEELERADAVFSPSPMVAKSLASIDISPDKIIHSSYGWDPARFEGEHRALAPINGVTILFVGSILVRKGVVTLLRAWEKAKIRGRLVLVGSIEPLIADVLGPLLARDDVVHIPFTVDVGSYLRSADWFIFPTLEEGGPQVTYEAAGCGVPVLVTPMGAGALARDGVEGIVLDSNDSDDWAALIRSLPDRWEEREILAQNARIRATEFTYDKVGARRRSALLNRFQDLPAVEAYALSKSGLSSHPSATG